MDYAPPGSAGVVWSISLAIVLLGFGWGFVILAMLYLPVRLTRMQARENAYMHERARWRLAAGPSRVVHGRVDAGASVAIEVDIHQVVQNQTSKNSRWHTWKESFREQKVRAFKLVHADGQTVLVERGNEVFVVDSLTTDYPLDKPSQRVRSAIVRESEEIFVYGDLFEGPAGGAYRGGGAFVLRPPRGGRLLVATEAMRDRYRDRVRYLRRVGLMLAALFCVFHGIFTLPFALAAAVGHREMATVSATHSYVTHGKGGPTTHYVLTARASDGFTLESEVSARVYMRAARSLAQGAPDAVPMIRMGQSTWASYLGDEPHLPAIALVLGMVVALIATAIAVARFGDKLAWYDRKLLVEHGGSGHWIETRTSDGKGPPIDPMRN